MVQEIHIGRQDNRQLLLLQTSIKLRWLAIVGQSLAVLFVNFGLGFDFPAMLCGALIASSIWLNIFMTMRYPASYRPSDDAATMIFIYDIAQLGGLLYLTGGLQNPFSILLIVPVVVSATSHSLRRTLLLGLFVVIIATILVFFHEPLPWTPGIRPVTPFLYIAGTWVAILSSLLFTAIYTFRVAEEGRRLADALTATELVLQREQHLSALDGMAAAAAHELGTPLATIALVAREMQRELGEDNPLSDDAKLLRSQAERCREILQKLTSLSEDGDDHLGDLPVTSLIEEVVAPHRNFGIDIEIRNKGDIKAQPVGHRNPGVLYGLGNLIENAVDFAHSKVDVETGWDDENVSITISDDGPGFPSEVLRRIGEPFVTARRSAGEQNAGGLGLGLFIAKTLLDRSGAVLTITNQSGNRSGATVEIVWRRDQFDRPASMHPQPDNPSKYGQI